MHFISCFLHIMHEKTCWLQNCLRVFLSHWESHSGKFQQHSLDVSFVKYINALLDVTAWLNLTTFQLFNFIILIANNKSLYILFKHHYKTTWANSPSGPNEQRHKLWRTLQPLSLSKDTGCEVIKYVLLDFSGVEFLYRHENNCLTCTLQYYTVVIYWYNTI